MLITALIAVLIICRVRDVTKGGRFYGTSLIGGRGGYRSSREGKYALWAGIGCGAWRRGPQLPVRRPGAGLRVCPLAWACREAIHTLIINSNGEGTYHCCS